MLVVVGVVGAESNIITFATAGQKEKGPEGRWVCPPHQKPDRHIDLQIAYNVGSQVLHGSENDNAPWRAGEKASRSMHKLRDRERDKVAEREVEGIKDRKQIQHASQRDSEKQIEKQSGERDSARSLAIIYGL